MRLDNRHHALSGLFSLSTCIIRNDSGYNMPPYSFVRLSGIDVVSGVDGGTAGTDIVCVGSRIETENWEPMVSTGAVAIPAGKQGPGYRGDTLVVSGSGIALGDRCRPAPNAFTAVKDRRGLWVCQGVANGVAILVKETHSGLYPVKTTTSVTKRVGSVYGKGTVEFYTHGAVDGTFYHSQSGEAYPVFNMATKEEIAINSDLQVTVMNGQFVANWEECP